MAISIRKQPTSPIFGGANRRKHLVATRPAIGRSLSVSTACDQRVGRFCHRRSWSQRRTASEIRASTRPWQMQIDKIEDDDGRSEIQNPNRRRCPMHVDNKARTHSERTHADSTNPAPTCAEQQWKYNRAAKTNHIKCSNFARQILLTPGYTSSINSPLAELLTGYN